MRTLILALAFAWAGTAHPAWANDKATGNPPPAEAADQAAPAKSQDTDKNRKICRAEIATGSVMPKRVCHTVAELEAMRAQAAATKESLRR